MEQTIDRRERIGIVADDLTSAADGAAAFLARGYAPLICRQEHPATRELLVSIDTGSRMLDEAAAGQATGRAVAALAKRTTLYKTIDSTLRGHIRSEIAAAFRASGRKHLVIAPAFPAAGRTTISGIQLLDGMPVAETAYGRDPVHPAGTSAIRDLIEPELGRIVIVPADLAEAEIGRHIADAPVVILDATSQTTLNRRVATLAPRGSTLWVGSPGMAAALATIVPSAPATHTPQANALARVLVLVGSANPVSHEQCGRLAATGVAIADRSVEIDTEASVACLRAPQNRSSDPATVLTTLIDEALTTLSRQRYDAVIATGGETMNALMERLSIRSFTLLREIEPGFPLGRAQFPSGRVLLLAMKAGGFGSAETLCNAADTILDIGRKHS
ncbi:four-carbon acid sugar kinase family protein [Shinella sp. M27]|uniref:four-carbon acid sugar kinase family protein n=1 Tax=Shinella sp. M27 TaxID=3368614 RepID=UPI003B9EC4D7